jgi:hypothetical protein
MSSRMFDLDLSRFLLAFYRGQLCVWLGRAHEFGHAGMGNSALAGKGGQPAERSSLSRNRVAKK